MQLRNRLSLALVATCLSAQSSAFSLRSLGIDLGSLLGEQQPLAPSTELLDRSVKQIAIIGAGAAGSSAAYHLQKFAAESDVKVNITIYEKSSYVGGRSTTVNAYSSPFYPLELGASIFVKVNSILYNATEEFGLDTSLYRTASSDDGDDILGIWNGERFVFEQAEGRDMNWWDYAKMFWKYGLAPLKTQRLMQDVVTRFLKLYEEPIFPFSSLTESLDGLDLLKVTGVTGEQLLKENGIGGAFPTDIIQASTRVNYASNLGMIHGVEAMVCMATDGAISIKGGNWQIFERMVNASGAYLHLNTSVTSISKSGDLFTLRTSTPTSKKGQVSLSDEIFDAVVLAAPYQFSSLKISDSILPAEQLPDEIPYVELHVTLLTSPLKLSPKFFNLTEGTKFPNTILTTLGPDENASDGVGKAGFFSISTLRSVVNPTTGAKEYAYKIFSPEGVTSEFLSKLFDVELPADLTAENEHITWFYPHVWYSYPVELPRVTFEEPQLAEDLYYTAGMESFISTMETSGLSGMNVARLIVNSLTPKSEAVESSVGDGEVVALDSSEEKETIPQSQVELESEHGETVAAKEVEPETVLGASENLAENAVETGEENASEAGQTHVDL